MGRKFRKICFSILVILAVITGLLWVFVNYIFIPRIVVPKVQEYINSYQSGPLRLFIGKINFNPFTGFRLQDVNFSGNVVLKDNCILRAKTVNIDLALLPLLKKRIQIKRFKMSGTTLNVGRDDNGNWNFMALLSLLEGQGGEDVDFVINEFEVREGCIYYADHVNPVRSPPSPIVSAVTAPRRDVGVTSNGVKKDIMLERNFTNVVLSLTRLKGPAYELILSGSAGNKSEESFELNLHYDINQNTVSGKAKLNTKNIEEYCDYYLEEVLNPWHLKAEDIGLELNFSYEADTWILNGYSKMESGVFSYGEYIINGDAGIKHESKYVVSTHDADISRIELSLGNVSFSIDKDAIINNAEGKAVITEDEINIESLKGQLQEHPMSCSGIFKLKHPRELYLTGKIGDLNNNLQLKVLEENQGTMDWLSNIRDSYIKMHADISDLEKLLFVMSVEGNIKLEDLFTRNDTAAGDISTDEIKGTINLTGTVKREGEEVLTFEEELRMNVEDFSMLGLAPISFNFNLDIKDGVLTGDIPKTEFYKGSLWGLVKMDFSRWGTELHIDGFDMGEFSKADKKLEGIRGIFNGNISLVSKWEDFNTVRGGGYFQFNNCYLWNAPIFKQTIEGVNTVVKDVETPDFRKLEGNFEIGEKNIALEYVYADVSPLKLNIKGKIKLSGSVDFTVGVMLSSGSIFRSIRQILLPGTILFDVIANCIEVDIYNTWEDLKYNVGIQPAAFITAIFPGVHNTAVPDKYNLEGFWSPPAKEESTKKSVAIQPRKKMK